MSDDEQASDKLPAHVVVHHVGDERVLLNLEPPPGALDPGMELILSLLEHGPGQMMGGGMPEMMGAMMGPMMQQALDDAPAQLREDLEQADSEQVHSEEPDSNG